MRPALVLGICLLLPSGSLLAAPTVEPPPGHEASSGVAVAGGGFITVTAVWVTPTLTDSVYYQQWLPAGDDRQMHRQAAAAYTVILLEVANRSRLILEGHLSVNVRLLVDGERRRPIGDEALARTFPSLLPPQHRETIPPDGTFLRAYAFAKLAQVRQVALIVRPLSVIREGRYIGQLQEFELRFDPARLRFPP